MSFDGLVDDPALPVANPTTSYWQTPPNERLLGIQSAQLPFKADIAIIGSGVSACSVVHELLTSGYTGSVAILEAREICSGATGRNGGRVHVHAIQDYDKYRRRLGDEAAEKIIRFQMLHWEAINNAAKSLSPENRKRAALRETESVAAVFSKKKLEDLETLLANFEAAFPDCVGRWRIIGAEETQTKYKIKHATGALIGIAGAAWPYRLITGIFSELLDAYGDRLSLEANTPVQAVSRDPDFDYSYSLKTPRGQLRAKHVVFCTEAHTSHLLPKLRGIIVPRRGQMTVQSPGNTFEDLRGKRSWNFYFDTGFDYLHQNPTNGDIIIGGGDFGGFEGAAQIYGVPSDAMEELPAKTHLSGVLRVVFGKQAWGEVPQGRESIKSSWTGILGNSLDHTPLVGPLPQEALHDRRIGRKEKGAEWICAGFGGYGMTNSWMSGVALARQLAGQATPLWLPEPYIITSSRLSKLQAQVAEIQHTDKHLRALL
ncbi:FAD dependent oxidoreductase [Mariannaea sp. PMI_226]|nr:FAD dependent oxidoreductase [Mariannaea sp. PMI_226]